ncbi:hypothetical protein QBC34DRAFT_409535 [Podospora aff. communis PSN243]|uniref:MFS maltose permease n=1 Tax=Podospora aff. communis PSN243 TaxID=3040156 RepID=A0AAV9GH46_9PEZI|nr:hypothetical protein QBC34DRAFT_409535 [Podospora aff. communis PSN243]
MRPRLVLPRRPVKRPSPAHRTFFQSSIFLYGPRSRPQLPFLSVTSSAQRVRHLTTERRERIKYEIKMGIKYTAYIWAAAGLVFVMISAVNQEILEREYPTPHEWSFLTRQRFRGGHAERNPDDPNLLPNWNVILLWMKGALERLEDPAIDGYGLKDAPPDRPPGTKDISAKSEQWRRGYFDAMMLYAKSAEHMDGWVRDKTRDLVFPPGTMVGPSNLSPRPLPPMMKGPRPKEQDCELAFEPADDVYLRLIATEGLTVRQQLDARLAFANWLEFKGDVGPAGVMYQDAVELALSQRPSLPEEAVDKTSWTLNDAAGQPSANLLTSLTAFATHKARTGDVITALSIFVSLLRARRSLPTPDTSITASLGGTTSDNSITKVVKFFRPPPYPAPPPDGSYPPVRDSKELCEEAAISLHIGEILYASQQSSREEGLGWTREGVDIAEEQLHKLGSSKNDLPARTTCRECLSTGLENWSVMVARLAKEEAAKKEAAVAQPKKSSWFGLWGKQEEENLTRWVAEAKVIEERRRRSQKLLEEIKPPPNAIMSLFSV